MAKQRTPVLKVSKLSKSYGPVAIVTDFSLEVWPGDAIALTGRNGAGPTRLAASSRRPRAASTPPRLLARAISVAR